MEESTILEFRALAKAVDAAWLKTRDSSFTQKVDEYRQVEQEFVQRAGDDAFFVLETKRCIAEAILRQANVTNQPFNVCQDIWNELVQLGFSNIESTCTMSWFYADCCLHNKQYDAGLEVLDTVIAEIHLRLDEPALTRHAVMYYNHELTRLGKHREGLVAFQTSEAEGIAWVKRRDAEIDAQRPSPQEQHERKLSFEMVVAIHAIAKTSSNRSFADVARDIRQVEADSLARLQGDDAFFVPDAKQRISFALIKEANQHHESFEVCHDLWNELLQRGFADLKHKCTTTWFYADSCLFNKQPDVGLPLVEPLIAELQKLLREDPDAEVSEEEYPEELARLQKLCDQLKAIPQ